MLRLLIQPYGLVLLALLASLAASVLIPRYHARHPIDREADRYLEGVNSRLLDMQWPADTGRLAAIRASFAAIGARPYADGLERVYANARMHALLGEPAPTHASVDQALHWLQRQAQEDREARRYGKEFDLLWDRVVMLTLAFEVAPASSTPTWPGDLPPEITESGYRYDPAGAWVAKRRNERTGYQAIHFPLRVVNRSGETTSGIDGAVTFYFEQLQRPGMPRPGAAFKCPVRVERIAPGEIRIVDCTFVYPSFARDAVDKGLNLLHLARTGELKSGFEAATMPSSALWQLPEALPLNPEEPSRHAQLQAQDQLRARNARALDESLAIWFIFGGIGTAGLTVAGVFESVGARIRLVRFAGFVSAALLVLVPLAWLQGGSGWGPLVYGMGAFWAVAFFAGGVLIGRFLAPLRWLR